MVTGYRKKDTWIWLDWGHGVLVSFLRPLVYPALTMNSKFFQVKPTISVFSGLKGSV